MFSLLAARRRPAERRGPTLLLPWWESPQPLPGRCGLSPRAFLGVLCHLSTRDAGLFIVKDCWIPSTASLHLLIGLCDFLCPPVGVADHIT